MKKAIILALMALLLISIAGSQLSLTEETDQKTEIKTLETTELNKENQEKIKETYTHNTKDLGEPISYQEKDNMIIINFDSGWRVFTTKETFPDQKINKSEGTQW